MANTLISHPDCSLAFSDAAEELVGTLEIPGYSQGDGGFADVYHGFWTNSQGERAEVAIKILKTLYPRTRQIGQDSLIKKAEMRIKREVFFWSQMKHPNLHPLLGYQLHPQPHLVSPWCRHGDLGDYVRRNPSLTRSEKLHLIHQAGCGLNHLHSFIPPICHADIKPENVLINDLDQAALSDFGLAMLDFEGTSGFTTSETIKGTLAYMAAQLFSGEKPSRESDVFAFGGLILAVMSNKPPLHGLCHAVMLRRIMQNEQPKPEDHLDLPAEDPLWKLMHRCWDSDALARPTISEILIELWKDIGDEHFQQRSDTELSSRIDNGSSDYLEGDFGAPDMPQQGCINPSQETRDPVLEAAAKATPSAASTDNAPSPSAALTLLIDSYSLTTLQDGRYNGNAPPRPPEQDPQWNMKPNPIPAKKPSEEHLDDTLMPESSGLRMHSTPIENDGSVPHQENTLQEAINEAIDTEKNLVRDVECLRNLPDTLDSASVSVQASNGMQCHFASEEQLCGTDKDAASAYEQPLPNDPGEPTLDDSELSVIPSGVPLVLDPAIGTYTLPTKVTDCSCCGTELDTFRYICSTCGEKIAHSKGENIPGYEPSLSEEGNSQGDSNTKSKASDSKLSSDNARSPTGLQPPLLQIPGNQQPPSASPASSLVSLAEPKPRLSPLAALLNLFRSELTPSHGVISKVSESRPRSSQSERSSLSVLSPPEIAFSSGGVSPTLPRLERQTFITSALEQGYELCSDCLSTAGLSHTGRIRHAFVENLWDGSAWTIIEQEDKPVCSICKASLTSKRYKCVSCPLFNLCRGCYSQVHEIHPAHVFLVVLSKPKTSPNPSPTPLTGSNRESTVNELSLQHPNVSCFNCRLDIFGARFHCAVCESVDICQNCESAGLPGNLTPNMETGHVSSHIMVKIPYPLDSAEVAIENRRARVLWSEQDAATINATTKRITSSPRFHSADFSNATSAVAIETREPNLLDHNVVCGGCGINIVGRRYQCANCPSYPVSYNLCAECERNSFVIHPFPHVFLKFNRRVDHPVQTRDPLLPVIYEIPADGDFMDSIGNAARYIHEIAFCDLCMTPIRGVWYRCGHCNSDLCDFHEQTHNEDHSFIVIKAKASLGVLQDVWDFENPCRNAPLLQPVYSLQQ